MSTELSVPFRNEIIIINELKNTFQPMIDVLVKNVNSLIEHNKALEERNNKKDEQIAALFIQQQDTVTLLHKTIDSKIAEQDNRINLLSRKNKFDLVVDERPRKKIKKTEQKINVSSSSSSSSIQIIQPETKATIGETNCNEFVKKQILQGIKIQTRQTSQYGTIPFDIVVLLFKYGFHPDKARFVDCFDFNNKTYIAIHLKIVNNLLKNKNITNKVIQDKLNESMMSIENAFPWPDRNRQELKKSMYFTFNNQRIREIRKNNICFFKFENFIHEMQLYWEFAKDKIQAFGNTLSVYNIESTNSPQVMRSISRMRFVDNMRSIIYENSNKFESHQIISDYWFIEDEKEEKEIVSVSSPSTNDMYIEEINDEEEVIDQENSMELQTDQQDDVIEMLHV